MNSPKEKADELFTRYYVMLLETDSQISEEVIISILSQQLALIAVDEIIQEVVESADNEIKSTRVIYWQKVKQEINKL
jgi:hypothetical protein